MGKIPDGTKVFVVTTGELGVLRSYMDKYTAIVDIDGNLRTVHATAVVKASEFELREKEETPKTIDAKRELPAGIWLVMEPMRKMNGETERYALWLCNRLNENLWMDYTYLLRQSTEEKLKKELPSGADIRLHFFKPDNLNDLPQFNVTFWINTGSGTGRSVSKELKLKAKQFFSQLESDVFKQRDFLAFEILKALPDEREKTSADKEDADIFKKPPKKKIAAHQVLEKAAMPDYIDLHIEKLVADHARLEKSEILSIQLRHFERFLDKAITYNLHRIYAIHGLGTGKLKEEIEKVLRQTPEVVSYNNDYNVRFGFGATEIYL